MEELMYFVWSNRIFNTLSTIDDTPIEVIHPGLRNLDAGPDFFNAKVRINGTLWAGNVEMHCKASDWFRHHHQNDRAYDNVILHVVLQADDIITLPNGEPIQTAVMKIPAHVMEKYQQMSIGSEPQHSAIRCTEQLPLAPTVVVHDWMSALAIQRMLNKVKRVRDLIEDRQDSWMEAFYVILCRSLGTGINGDPFERLARSLPYTYLLKHADNLLQLRAMLLGQASLIRIDDTELLQEYAFLRAKFNLTPMPTAVWKMARLRPYASPEIRLNALALLLHRHRNLLNDVMEAPDIPALQHIFMLPGKLGVATTRSILINAVVPIIIAYGQWQGDEELSERAIAMLEQLPSEANRYMEYWMHAGLPIRNAFDSQALLQLYKEYCEPHKCMQCRIGCWIIKQQPGTINQRQ